MKRFRIVRLAARACAVMTIAAAIAVPVCAQAQPKKAAAPPPNDPRRGPRLTYTRGPAACLSEASFRDEVAIVLDGVDHFDERSDDVLSVAFEAVQGGYRSTLVYTSAGGRPESPTVKSYSSCEVLGRWVASTASGYIPEKPKPAPPPPPPLPELPACEIRPVCPNIRLSPWAPWAAPSSLGNFDGYQMGRTNLSFLERLRKMNVTIALSGMVLAGVGVTESVAPGFGIGGEMRGERFSFGVELRGTVPGPVHANEPIDPTKPYYVGAEADVSEWTGLLVPCFRYKYFVGCAVVQGGAMAWKNPFDGPHGIPVLSVGPRAGIEVPLGERLALFGFGEALVRIIQPGLDATVSPTEGYLPANVSWTASPVAGYLTLGLAVKLN